MFTKKPHIDVKKSIQKILDIKKDPYSRLKHLKQCLDLPDFDAKSFFENNYSHVYYIFFETISNLDTTFKQKAQKQAKEEQDLAIFILEKILIYLPEILNKGWQQHSIGFLLQRLLHHANSLTVRCEGLRLFLIWYQILGTNAKQNVHHMFASLVPGIIPEIPNPYINNSQFSTISSSISSSFPIVPNDINESSRLKTNLLSAISNQTSQSVSNSYYQNQQVNNLNYNNVSSNVFINNNPIFASEIEPMIPSFVLEKKPQDYTVFFLQNLLNYLVNQVNKIQWKENKRLKQRQCFRFLFEQFSQIYLKNIFSDLDENFSFYNPNLDLPELRIISLDKKFSFNNKRFQTENTSLECKSRCILWFAKFMKSNQIDLVKNEQSFDKSNNIFVKQNSLVDNQIYNQTLNENNSNNVLNSQVKINQLEPTPFEHDLVFSLLTSSRSNINLVHQILNQTFLMPFSQANTIREVISVYREWIHKNYSQVPIFLDEPLTDQLNSSEDIRAGLSPFYRIFITYSSNVFLLKCIPLKKSFLDEQVEMCKRVLNVYRFMVMKVEMDKKTWEQLLQVVLRITSLVLSEQLPTRKQDTLGGRLAPAFFETLIVTWIKANLNIFVNSELWDQFQRTLKSLTCWEELIKEWSRTMDTLTRVMSRYVYNINLLDLPLERPTDRKNKRQTKNKSANKVNFSPKVQNSFNSFNNDSNVSQQANITQNSDFNDTKISQSLCLEKKSSKISFFENSSLNQSSIIEEKFQSFAFKIIKKSSSDTNLLNLKKDELTKTLNFKNKNLSKSLFNNFLSELNETFEKELKSSFLINIKSKSQFNVSNFNIMQNSNGNEIDFNSDINSIKQSRSPSPVSCSNNIDTNNSLKESPLNLDGLSIAINQSQHNNNNFVSSSQNLQQSDQDVANKSVITGGSYKNWSPDSAVILWRRMLGVLGDINDFNNPSLHLLGMQCLSKIVEDFVKIRDNLGVVIDSGQSFDQNNVNFFPSIVPPLDHFVSWLFEATYLPDEFKQGKLIAYKLLCIIAVKKHEPLMENDFLPMFYHTIHIGLNSCDMEIISVIVRYCKAKLFSYGLPGSSCLLYDFTEAAKMIINSNEIKEVPRYEALSLLGTLIGMNEIYQKTNALASSQSSPVLVNNRNHQNFILELLIKAAKKEQTSLGRSVALNSLGIYLYQQLSLSNENLDNHILSIINVLIGCTKFPNRTLSRNACDIIRLQCDFSEFLLKRYPKIVTFIIEGLISSIRYHVNIAEKQSSFKDYQNLIITMMICLCEWCLSLPKDYLKYTQSTTYPTESVLYSILKLLNDLSGYNAHNFNSSNLYNSNSFLFKKCFEDNSDIDYTIEIDNLAEVSAKRTKFDSQKINLEFTNSSSASLNSSTKNQSIDDLAVIWMASSMLLNHLLNFVGNFPLSKLGPSRLSCYLNEFDDNSFLIKNVDNNELNSDLFNAPNILFFIVNNSSIISFIDLSSHNENQKSTIQDKNNTKVNEINKLRIIFRDINGKFSWTCSNIHSINTNKTSNYIDKNFDTSLPSCVQDDDINQMNDQRPDPLDLLIQHLNETSPECMSMAGTSQQYSSLSDRKKTFSQSTHSITNLQQKTNQIEQSEENMMALLINQHYQEMNYAEKLLESQTTNNLNKKNAIEYQEKVEKGFEIKNIPTEFLSCRKFIEQIGFLNWEKRTKIELLAKNEKVLRELRNLDKQKGRETFKIAVIYVKEGQEDKHSILLNDSGSKEFEQFVSGLGWEVDLGKHLGFRGGLESNLSTGKTTSYYANAFYEVIFHISTRIPSVIEKNLNDDSEQTTLNDNLNKKLKHLGNDEVHIVWSEHYRNYRRGIIPTEFCDVLIVIYPIKSFPGYYRITVSRKSEIPFFGPLYNESVVHLSVLGSLVRATAINASRVQRSQVPFYQHFFEERNQCLQNIFKQHKELTSFETFSSNVYTPKQQNISGNNFFQNSDFDQNKKISLSKSISVSSNKSTNIQADL